MYLFQRTATLQGGVRRPMAWAAEITAYVNANSPVQIGLWATRFGFPLGTVVWSARVESRAQLNDVMTGLMAKDSYHDLVERGQEFIAAPAQDSLRQLIHGEGMGATAPTVGTLATVITATPAPGQLVNAIGWGVEITKKFHGIAGGVAAFYSDCYGPFGQLTWIAVQPNSAAVDTANDKLNASADYLAMVDSGGDLFVPGSGMQGLAERIA